MVGNLTRQPRRFARSTQTAAPSRPASTPVRPQAHSDHGQAEALLREMAFVLHLTRSVKQRILEERETAARVPLALAATNDGL